MGNVQSFSFPSSDGVHTIQAREWLPEGQPKAVVQIVHGVAEYVERYDHVAQFLTQHGYVVCGEDHLGHGRTAKPEEYGWFADRGGWDLISADVHKLRQLQGEKYPGILYFLVGHSMGSFLTRTFLCRWPGEVDGAVLSGTGQESAFNVTMGRLLSGLICKTKGSRYVSPMLDNLSLGGYNKKFKPNRTSADWISRDEEVVDTYLKDPLCSFKPSAGMFHDMMGGLQYISSQQALARMDKNTPIYFFSGDKDPVGAMGKGVHKVYGFFEKQGVRDLSLKLYPEGRHEMLNELNRDEVKQDLLAWLDGHVEKK